VRVNVTARVDLGRVLIGTIAYSFELWLASGTVVEPIEEYHRASDLLAREDDELGPGDEVTGDIWFEVGPDQIKAITFASDAFDLFAAEVEGKDDVVAEDDVIAWELP
jgi:hypothetical protein